MTDFDLDSLLNEPDGECTVSLKGREVTFHIEAPGHVAFIEAQRAEANLRKKIEDSEEGEVAPYGGEDVADHYRFVDDHVVRIEDEEWSELPEPKRMKVLHALHSREFWKLVNAIAKAGRLDDGEGGEDGEDGDEGNE